MAEPPPPLPQRRPTNLSGKYALSDLHFNLFPSAPGRPVSLLAGDAPVLPGAAARAGACNATPQIGFCLEIWTASPAVD